jgi:phosphoadenosine phosphosulfate reductase
MIAKTIQHDLYGKSFEELAISRIKQYEPPEGYYLAFSGGKDSIVIYDLAVRAGVKFDAHFNRTTVDPQEVLKFIKENYPDVIWEKPKMSMFQLIRKEKCLPSIHRRFCCRNLKEVGGNGRTVITGVRWQESHRRKKRQVFEESYKRKKTFFLHPIIEWSDQDVWAYIRKYQLPYCTLYDEGHERIGCIMCPMKSPKAVKLDAERWPKYYKAYLRAIQYILDNGRKFKCGTTAEEVMNWWMNKR